MNSSDEILPIVTDPDTGIVHYLDTPGQTICGKAVTAWPQGRSRVISRGLAAWCREGCLPDDLPDFLKAAYFPGDLAVVVDLAAIQQEPSGTQPYDLSQPACRSLCPSASLSP